MDPKKIRKLKCFIKRTLGIAAYRQFGLPAFGRREDEGELEQAPGPDGEDHDAESLVRVHLLVL